jgi:hypothetical protein
LAPASLLLLLLMDGRARGCTASCVKLIVLAWQQQQQQRQGGQDNHLNSD